MRLGELSLEDAAEQAAGNWQSFECFVWDRRNLPDGDKWAIVYTSNRDSGLIDQSNADAIDKALKPFTRGKNPNVFGERHSHWAVGYVDGYAIRVYKRGRITKAFRTYHELAQRLAEYPILDEQDYSNREYQATLENFGNEVYRLKHEYDLPDGWESAAFGWLANNDDRAIENCDDQGGYATEEQLRAAFDALGYKQLEAV